MTPCNVKDCVYYKEYKISSDKTEMYGDIRELVHRCVFCSEYHGMDLGVVGKGGEDEG